MLIMNYLKRVYVLYKGFYIRRYNVSFFFKIVSLSINLLKFIIFVEMKYL